jgi:ABC-type transport system involved in multi-copper enzyme maturation permease subunit
MRLFRSSLRKLRRRPASWVTFLLLVGMLLLLVFFIVVATLQVQEPQGALAARQFLTFPAAYELTLQLVLGLGGLLAVTYGAAVAGSEWTWGTLKSAVARGESRTRYTLAGYAGVAVFTWIGALGAFLAGVVAVGLGALAVNASLGGLGDAEALARMPELFARACLGLAMNAAIGFAIATVARSQLAGIGVGIGLFFLEGVASVFLPEVLRWFPFSASGAVAGGTFGQGAAIETGLGASLDPDLAIPVVLAWLAVSLTVACVFTERADISG